MGMRRLAFALLLSLPVVACGQAAELEVADPWTRATVGSTANAAVYMTITSPTADRLVAASAPVARKTDLMTMEMTMEGGSSAMTMVYVEAIDIPANEPVSLNPSGLHVWLEDLHQPLAAGQSFPLSLEFEMAGQREVVVSIVAPTATPPQSEMGM